jgi:hypothetical protein
MIITTPTRAKVKTKNCELNGSIGNGTLDHYSNAKAVVLFLKSVEVRLKPAIRRRYVDRGDMLLVFVEVGKSHGDAL